MKADKLIIATRENRSIIIEVKSFLQSSFIHELSMNSLRLAVSIKRMRFFWQKRVKLKQYTWPSVRKFMDENSAAKQLESW
jgi:hypothetical protein